MEDVHQLLATGREESYLFLVDSRMRDPAVFPTPSHYEITFASPFRNVFGLDLLDATIARTEYIVETNTNVLEYVMGQPASLAAWNQGAWVRSMSKRRLEVPPGDYNLAQFVKQLNDSFMELASAHGDDPIKVSVLTNPGEISNRLAFTCSGPFTFLMSGSTLRHTLGFGDPVTPATAPGNYATVPGFTVNRTEGASDLFLSMPASTLADRDPQLATAGPVPAGSGVQFVALYGARRLRQYFASQAAGPASAVLTYAFAAAGAPALRVSVHRASDNATLASGSVQIAADDPNDVYVPVACTLTAAAPGAPQLESGQSYYVEFAAADNGGSSAAFVGVYFNQDNLPVDPSRYMALDGSTAAYEGDNVCCDVSAASWGHQMRSPGLVNLSGPRYVNIRCPEVESHMFRDRVNERCHAGLGMVQLRGYGFREQRFDFVSFPPRRFHPIGKLSKLSFRLERPDGTLYDSHGVDHTLLLVLKYYSLPNAPPPAAAPGGSTGGGSGQSVLNPNYVPDLRRYMIEHRWAAEAAATDPTYKVY